MNEDTTLYAIWSDISVTLDKQILNMEHHDTEALTVTIEPDEATNNQVVWYSNDTDVVVVDQSGAVTTTGEGSTTVVAWVYGVYDTCTVTVAKKPVSGVTLSASSKTLSKDEMVSLHAKVTPANATYPDIMWTSSNSSVATVDDRGVVTAKNAGSSTITAMADGKTATCDITVQQPVTSVTLSCIAVGNDSRRYSDTYGYGNAQRCGEYADEMDEYKYERGNSG